MAMPHSLSFPDRAVWTVDDLEQLPDDGNRYEILHGELLVTSMPTWGHQGVAMRLTWLLLNWCRAHPDWSIRAPGGVYISTTTWLEPDVAVYRAPDRADLSWKELPPPVLVVEVLSPSTRRRDRFRKRPAYLNHGVGEVWTVDAQARTIERWTSASEFPDMRHDTFSWMPPAPIPAGTQPLEVSFVELFGPPADGSA